MKKFIISTAVILAFLFGNTVLAQPTPPDHGQGTNQPAGPGGGAPIGEGIAFLVAMGAAYAYKKIALYQKKALPN